MHTSTDFILHGGDAAFANRQKLLFDKLSVAEKECSKRNTTSQDVEMEVEEVVEQQLQLQQPRGVKRKSETKRFRGKESIFKRPEGPAPRNNPRNIPDFRRNPHKWVKYSLDDVSNDDMTDRSNTQAALSFLKELKARKSKEPHEEPHENINVDQQDDQPMVSFKPKTVKKSSEVEFRKPVNPGEERASVIVEPEESPMFRGSKIIMPEYVVGQRQKKETKRDRPVVRVERTRQLKLDHLDEPDEEEI